MLTINGPFAKAPENAHLETIPQPRELALRCLGPNIQPPIRLLHHRAAFSSSHGKGNLEFS